MFRATLTALFFWAFLQAQSYGQDVFVPRELKAIPVSRADKETQPAKKERSANDSIPAKHPTTDAAAAAPAGVEPATLHPKNLHPAKTNVARTAAAKEAAKTEPPNAAGLKPPSVNHAPDVEKLRATRVESVEVPTTKTRIEEVSPEKTRTAKTEAGTSKGFTERVGEDLESGLAAKSEPRKPQTVKEPAASPHADRAQAKIEPDDLPGAKEQPTTDRSGKTQTAKAEPEVTAGRAKRKQSENSQIVKSSADVGATENSHSTRAQATKFDPIKVLPEKEPSNSHSERSKPTN